MPLSQTYQSTNEVKWYQIAWAIIVLFNLRMYFELLQVKYDERFTSPIADLELKSSPFSMIETNEEELCPPGCELLSGENEISK